MSTETLEAILLDTIDHGEKAVISSPELLRSFGLAHERRLAAGALWQRLVHLTLPDGHPAESLWRQPLRPILEQGSLILQAAGPAPSREKLREVYAELCACRPRGASSWPAEKTAG